MLQLAMTNHAAVLGINFGRVGFLADCDRAHLATALGRIARGEAQVDERIEIDGRTTVKVPASASLEIRAAPRKARLVRMRPRRFYADLADRL